MHVNNFRTALNSKWQSGQVLFLGKVVQNIQEPLIRKFNYTPEHFFIRLS